MSRFYYFTAGEWPILSFECYMYFINHQFKKKILLIGSYNIVWLLCYMFQYGNCFSSQDALQLHFSGFIFVLEFVLHKQYAKYKYWEK